MLVVGTYSAEEADPGEVITIDESVPPNNDWGLDDTVADPADAQVFFELLNSGVMNVSDGDGTREFRAGFTWMNESKRTATIGELYEVKLAQTGGTHAPDSGPANNTLVDIDTDPRWTWDLTVVSADGYIGILTVREKADTLNLEAALITITLEVL